MLLQLAMLADKLKLLQKFFILFLREQRIFFEFFSFFSNFIKFFLQFIGFESLFSVEGFIFFNLHFATANLSIFFLCLLLGIPKLLFPLFISLQLFFEVVQILLIFVKSVFKLGVSLFKKFCCYSELLRIFQEFLRLLSNLFLSFLKLLLQRLNLLLINFSLQQLFCGFCVDLLIFRKPFQQTIDHPAGSIHIILQTRTLQLLDSFFHIVIHLAGKLPHLLRQTDKRSQIRVQPRNQFPHLMRINLKFFRNNATNSFRNTLRFDLSLDIFELFVHVHDEIAVDLGDCFSQSAIALIFE